MNTEILQKWSNAKIQWLPWAYPLIYCFYKTIQIHCLLLSHGGNPHTAGSNSSRLFKTTSAFAHRDLSTFWSGTMTTFIPAADAAATPFGASSNTRTLSGEAGGGWNLEAASKNISGAGFPCFSSGSSDFTTWENNLNNSPCFSIFIL